MLVPAALVLAVLAAEPPPASTTSSTTPPAPVPALRIPYERLRLPNGLTAILAPNRRLPRVAVHLMIQVGSKDERAGRTGFAHLFEHLMFMGTQQVPNGEFDRIMEAHGAVNNATTDVDLTNYFEEGPSNLLETFLWLEADRLATLPEAMTRAKVDLQREVVKNERRQTHENQPYGRTELVIPEKMYPKGHPYHHPVIGSHADLTAASVDDVKRFFATFYVPSNISLAVVGDFDPAQARQWIEKYFGAMPRKPQPVHATPPPASLAQSARVVLEDTVALPRVTRVWHAPATHAPGDVEAQLLAAVLAGGKSARLHEALVKEQKLAQSVDVGVRAQRHGSLFVIEATGLPDVTPERLEEALNGALADFARQPPSLREVERGRALLQTELLESVATPLGMAAALNEHQLIYGDPGQVERSLLTRYAPVTPSDVVFHARELLSRESLTVVVVPRLETKATSKPRQRSVP